MNDVKVGYLTLFEQQSLKHLMDALQMGEQGLSLVDRGWGQYFYDNEEKENIDYREGLERIAESMEKPLDEYVSKEDCVLLGQMFKHKDVPIKVTVDKTEKEKAMNYKSFDTKDFTGHEYEEEELER